METILQDCSEKLRNLVSVVQGAPYPSAIENELYTIWYERIQKTAVDCFEFLDANFPLEKENISKILNNLL